MPRPGLLDGRRAATHWRYAPLLARRYPAIAVDDRSLYVDGGDVLTSAGTAAGIDLCLHIVRADHGADVANAVARRMVVSPHRAGGQSQFVEAPVPPAAQDDPIARVQEWALEHLAERIGVPEMARAAHLSTRTLTRRFAAATGSSPARWLLEQRVAAGAALLERSDAPVEHVGALVGIPSPAAFRRHFARRHGRAAVGVPARLRGWLKARLRAAWIARPRPRAGRSPAAYTAPSSTTTLMSCGSRCSAPRHSSSGTRRVINRSSHLRSAVASAFAPAS